MVYYFSMGFGISLFSSVGSYYTYGIAPPYSVFDEYPGLFWVVLSYVSPDAMLLKNTFFITSLQYS